MSYPQYLRALLDLLFPERCLSCRMAGATLCPICVSYLPPAEQLARDLSACFAYRHEPTRRALWELKFKRKKHIAALFAPVLHAHAIEILAEVRGWNPGESRPFLAVPIPLAPSRLRERGFNQAEEIARALCAHADPGTLSLCCQILAKIRETPSQVSVHGKKERLKNLRGCFAVVDREMANGRDIVLIDDVITTGSTMEEARRVLTQCGARRVIGLAVAH